MEKCALNNNCLILLPLKMRICLRIQDQGVDKQSGCLSWCVYIQSDGWVQQLVSFLLLCFI